jgi:hypothetical protein
MNFRSLAVDGKQRLTSVYLFMVGRVCAFASHGLLKADPPVTIARLLVSFQSSLRITTSASTSSHNLSLGIRHARETTVSTQGPATHLPLR